MGTVYTQLSMQERRRIEDWWLAKVPVAEMARVLKRHKLNRPEFTGGCFVQRQATLSSVFRFA